MSDAPSELLRLFLRDHVSSFEQLQALLCLAEEPLRSLSTAEVSALTGVVAEQVESALDQLAQNGQLLGVSFRGRDRFYTYAPASPSYTTLVSELRRAYDEQLLSVVRMMSQNALERVRSTAARRLADAFRLDREKK